MNKNGQGNLTSSCGNQDVSLYSAIPEFVLLTSTYYSNQVDWYIAYQYASMLCNQNIKWLKKKSDLLLE